MQRGVRDCIWHQRKGTGGTLLASTARPGSAKCGPSLSSLVSANVSWLLRMLRPGEAGKGVGGLSQPPLHLL